jgi:hypothetical protein
MTEEEVERLIKELRGGSVPNLSIGGGWIVVKKEHLYPKDIFEYLLDTGELVRGCGGRRKKVKNTESEKYIGEGVFHKMVNQ